MLKVNQFRSRMSVSGFTGKGDVNGPGADSPPENSRIMS
jgi:hypothetical protein